MIDVKKSVVTTFGKVSLDKTHPWAAPQNGLSISPLLQRHYLHHLAAVVPGRVSELLNGVLGQRLCSPMQAQRLLDLYGSCPAVEAELEKPLTPSEQRPLPLRPLDPETGLDEFEIGIIVNACSIVHRVKFDEYDFMYPRFIA